MAGKLEYYSQLADTTAKQIIASAETWKPMLDTVARFYKYPFADQLMIYAQRPDATACASYDIWGQKMGRYVRRGSSGIALLDTSGYKPRIKYVFDISDTVETPKARTPRPWKYRNAYEQLIRNALMQRFEVDGITLADQLSETALFVVDDYWYQNKEDLLPSLEHSRFAEIQGDPESIRCAFCNMAQQSAAYILLKRCELPIDPDLDFYEINEFDTPQAAGALGQAASMSAETILREIENTIRKYERERSHHHERENQLHPDGRLPDSGSQTERNAGGTSGQVRDASEGLSGAVPSGALESAGAVGAAVSSSAGDRQVGTGAPGADAAGDGKGSRRDRAAQKERHDEVGGPDEQPEGTGGGSDPAGTGLRITDQLQQVSFFPSESEQIQLIEETPIIGDPVPASYTVAQADVDQFLIYGSNTSNHRMTIVSEFSKQPPMERKVALLKDLYHGGYGIQSGERFLSAWYGDDGIRITQGRASRYARTAQLLSWQDAANRIDELLEQGQFATDLEICEAPHFERKEIAQKLWYIEGDLSTEGREQHLLSQVSGIFRTADGGGFPKETEKLTEALSEPETVDALTSECQVLVIACKKNPDYLRFHYHRPEQILQKLMELPLPRHPYASEMTQLPDIQPFITEDEIDHALSGGSNVAGGKARIYEYFQENRNLLDRADFLKKEYGTGGRSHALSRSDWSDESHDSKGEVFKKRGCPEVRLTWVKVAAIVSDLIRLDRYFTPPEMERYQAIQQQKEEPITPQLEEMLDEPAMAASPQDRLKEITDKIEEGIQSVFESGNFQKYLSVMSRFHKYSMSNTMLIYMQNPNATLVAGFQAWQKKFERHVLRGERGITIIAPVPYKKTVEKEKLDPDTKLPELDENGDIITEEKEIRIPNFRPVKVFDISQTEGKPLPQIAAKLTGDVENYEIFVEAVRRSAPVPIDFESMAENMDGFFSPGEHRIAIRSGMSQVQTMSALIHEVTHSKLHDYKKAEAEAAPDSDPVIHKSRGTEEVEAESVSYSVCQYYGIETSENSFGYIASWSKDRTLPELRASLETINRTAGELISDIDRHFEEICKERGLNQNAEAEEKAAAPEEISQVQADTLHTEADFIHSSTDCYAIYQVLPEDPEKLMFMGMNWLKAKHLSVRRENYGLVYTGPLSGNAEDTDVLEQLYQKFNLNQVADYHGHSVSISDVIALNRNGKITYHFVDSVGFEEIPDFMEQLMTAEKDAVVLPSRTLPAEPEAENLESAQNLSDSAYAAQNLIPGETRFQWDDRSFLVSRVDELTGTVELEDMTFAQQNGFPIVRVEHISQVRHHLETTPETRPTDKLILAEKEPDRDYETQVQEIYPAEQNNLPYDVVIQTLSTPEQQPENYHIVDSHLGEGGPKVKFRANMEAIQVLKNLEAEGKNAGPADQEILARYVGWGGLADAFDPEKSTWAEEYRQLQQALTPAEYEAARGSTLNAHYTSPTIIKAMYEAIGRMGFSTGNILEPACGVGNFFGMLPSTMEGSRLYGVELDSISGRIAQQLYPKANITVAGFETTDRRDFFDLAIGNVPFGQYQVNDRAYNKLHFNIHNYFFAKALDQVRPGGVVAFITSRYTLDAKDSTVRRYLAQRADLLGAIRLPNTAFKANAGAEVVSDIIFLQKRESPNAEVPDWTQTAINDNGYAINQYFVAHPDMVLGQSAEVGTAHGKDYTVRPTPGADLGELLSQAVQNIHGAYQDADPVEESEQPLTSIPATPDVKNFSYTIVEGDIYYRKNSQMVKQELGTTADGRVRGMIALRDCVQKLMDIELDPEAADSEIRAQQAELNRLYDSFSSQYGLINDRANQRAFSDDSSYYLLTALEELDEDHNLKSKADMFTKRTIKPHEPITSVDTASEALAVSISEKAAVDMAYMSQLSGKTEEQLVKELQGIIFRVPGPEGASPVYEAADAYLSGNVRQKLREAQLAAADDPSYQSNVEALKAAQPKDLDASEIEVRLGATWISKEYYQQFMEETFELSWYLRRSIHINYSPFTAEWQITGKSNISYNDVAAYTTYGTERASAYKILEESLNLRDIQIYDTVTDADGRDRRVLNSKETTLAAQKQQAIRDAFKDWIWKDPQRRSDLVRQYNEEMNATRPRVYDGSHLVFGGINPAITLREHQKNAIAHIIYGGNTLLAHEVGAGKTFEMVAAAMESKRLGLCTKSLFVVPNHLIEQWASEFLRLYPGANILVTNKKDFTPERRKTFCARIATGDYDAVIMGHSQFERVPISRERQERLLQEQIWEIVDGIEEVQQSGGERFTVKQLEKTKKNLEQRLEKLQAQNKADDVVTFEQLGVDRLFVDEAHAFKNLFLYTKMRNVAGLSTSDAQKSSDMLAKCRYMDELTGGKGVIFATGTPVSNSMTELYTMQRYLQYDRLKEMNMAHFDCWASRFGETVTALELAPEGTGYRARTRFSKFFNLPELMNIFREVADIKTADQLNLPTPEVEYHNIVAQPTEHQKAMVQELSRRAAAVHSGMVDSSQDNMLKITTDGRKLGLDQRIINPLLPDEPGTKVNQCVENVIRIWRDGQADRLTQLIFCDISTPKTGKANSEEPSFTVYEDIRSKLIAMGMPKEQIAFIHEADTDAKKKELFGKVRSGNVRVLIGSTSKMGAGMNVQDRLVAMHDLDCPWRPGDLAQRKGRIERQGNQNKTVHVYRYVTEGTFDAYLWQTVENKQKFISQIMTSKSPVRSCEDVDETALSFAEIKALCAGDPRIKERMDLDVDVARLKLMKADYQSKHFQLEDKLLQYFPEQIGICRGMISGMKHDMETLKANPLPKEGFVGMKIGSKLIMDKEEAGKTLVSVCRSMHSSDSVNIGTYRNFTMTLRYNAFEQEYHLQLRGEIAHNLVLGTDPRGNLQRIENALNTMPDRLVKLQNHLQELQRQEQATKDQLEQPFKYEEELRIKTNRLIELDGLLKMKEDTKDTEQAEDLDPQLKEAMDLIDDYIKDEFGDSEDADYSDLTDIAVAYTSTEDGRHDVEAHINLCGLKIETLVDNITVRSTQYSTLGDMIDKALSSLDFEELTAVSDEEVEQALKSAGKEDFKADKKLPEMCYTSLPTGELAIIRKNQSGYERLGSYDSQDSHMAETMNGQIGVTKAQAAAMEAGMKYGWDTPGADPANYDTVGNPICRNQNSCQSVDQCADISD